MKDFEVTYFLGNAKYVFHYNDQIASEIEGYQAEVGSILHRPITILPSRKKILNEWS
jgi:hypothetical protein